MGMFITFIRTVIFYFITMFAIRIMGKRQIGQLEPTELVVTIIISELATIPMQDTESPVLNTLVAIFALVGIEVVISILSMKLPKLRQFISGRYSVIIDDGRLDVEEMRKVQLTVDELTESLRQNGILNIEDARYCILETGGRISSFSKNDVKSGELPVVLISDGVIVRRNLRHASLDKRSLKALVKEKYGVKAGGLLLLLYENGGFTAISQSGVKL